MISMRSWSGRGISCNTLAVHTNITLGEVVIHVEVVVVEGVVLLGVEDLEQRRRGIAAEVHGHLVHLVEQEDRVAAAGLLQALDHLAGQRTDVGAAVAADLGLVAHAAQG